MVASSTQRLEGLYAMRLTEASLVDDDVETTPVRTKKRQTTKTKGRSPSMRTRLGGGVRIWPSIKLRCRTTGTESKFIPPSASPLPDMDAGGTGRGVHAPLRSLPSAAARADLVEDIPQPGGLVVEHRPQRQGRLPVGDGLKSGDDLLEIVCVCTRLCFVYSVAPVNLSAVGSGYISGHNGIASSGWATSGV